MTALGIIAAAAGSAAVVGVALTARIVWHVWAGHHREWDE